ncbi:tRNA (guanine-N7)-methyltransferase [Myxococcus sp. CA051A]|uniref:tRNA (guanine-N(7)-)-methyltransferase n=1 Tax=Myxococcus llanfairpwllgwyngyllgogerychwyrndrobwllllantysiliogogogochensis TaxID=2590453 RepID=A0A540WI35_9BACT|nr:MULTISPECIES: tRNA (guanine-N7)-methyltransferase [Myxococcus]NTX00579.1 tRNA (guanine-N7)-methyltransferase [Myxococcus sp. CA040A]NTX12719.1 tRNA (guanine-N7)-methyltransferase [Myxococcus sp. CA056]NTX33738.1 tRNA (guanine-N7)-methyltransferase [Myxococcus sp. CA033]NTX59155.1 tRNA (guanine-N7)-methyltransferase [Myxococcus sp. CA051A]TQF08685.1 tRNA (guanine-N7)-methyltransferase [Myxococcus llanfairpwllgwyngyllgogerychwyrndrobwllllantysiliogogogochensis]
MPRPRLLPDPVGLHLIAQETPPDWDAEFGFPGPLELEIGSGAGGHALEYCRRNPTIRFVAFEWRKKYARDTQERAQKAGMKNLRVVESDARFAVPRIFAAGSLSAIHLQFPDPWWKRAHAKRAVVQPDFAALLLTRLAPGGRFDMRTDVEDRAHNMLSILESVGFHNPLGSGVFHPYDPEEVPSTRERRYLTSGEPVYRARLVKPA